MASLALNCCSCALSVASSMPSLAIASLRVSPLRVMLPMCGRSSKLMQRKNVDLPEPLEPMMLMTSPALADSDTPFKTSLSP